MDKDEAAAVLGAAGDAYFDQPCPTCAGEGCFVGDIMRPHHVTTCPTCEGDGKMQMPPPDEIRRAATILTEGAAHPEDREETDGDS